MTAPASRRGPSRATRLAVAGAAVLAVAAGGLVGALALRGDAVRSGEPRISTTYAEDRPAARALAREACALLERVVEDVRADAAADDVRRRVERLELTATEAYERDVQWARLLSATKALRLAFRDDDAQAARVGVDTGREECARLDG